MNHHQFDRGWAWMVDLGVFVAAFILIAWNRSMGLIFIEIQSMTGADAADVAWVGAGNAMTWHFLAPFSAILLKKFSARSMVLTGGVLFGGSLAAGFFVRELPGFIVMGVFVGIGGALCYTPSIVFLSHYFRRRLATATGFAATGTALAQITMTPLIAYMLEEYKLQGTMLIFSGISFNILVAAMLYFPVTAKQLDMADKQYQRELLGANKQSSENSIAYRQDKESLEYRPANIFYDYASDEDEDETGSAIARTDVLSIHGSVLALNEQESTAVDSVKRLLTNPLQWLLMMTFSVGSLLMWSLHKFGPAYAKDKGISIENISLFISLGGLPGIAVRLVLGTVADSNFVRTRIERYRIFAFGLVVPAVASFLFLLTTEYWGFLWNFLLIGTASGFFYLLAPVSVFDLIGKEDYGIGFGMMNFCAGVLFVLDSMALGKLRDVTGSYHASFILCGSLAVLTALVTFIAVPVVKRNRPAVL